jgi:hypothetical protein
MRHLLVVTAMFVVGLAITLGAASVLQDVAVARGKSAQSDGFEVDRIPKPAMKSLGHSRPSAIDALHDSRS